MGGTAENYIVDNLGYLRKRHYIRLADSRDYWFSFYQKRLATFTGSYGDEFCLVLYRAKGGNDAYVMPYSKVRSLFDASPPDHYNRWVGYVGNGRIHVTTGGVSIPGEEYYNAFHFLDGTADDIQLDGIDPSEVADDQLVLAERIAKYNELFRHVAPYKRGLVSEKIARPGLIANYLKRICGYACQVCGSPGFLQRNGDLYAEAHHIRELHRLLPGSYCSDNIVILCPTCHRKLHYGEVVYSLDDGGEVMVAISGTIFRFKRNVLSTPSRL